MFRQDGVYIMYALVFLILSVTLAAIRGQTITPVYVHSNNLVTLTCPADDQATTLTWTGPGGNLYLTGTTVEAHLGDDINGNPRIAASHTGGSYTLMFNEFRSSDTGIYTCTVDGTVNIQMVIVQGVMSACPVYTRQGETVTIQCPDTGGILQWAVTSILVIYSDGTGINPAIPDDTENRLSVTRQDGNYNLQISDIQLSDVREYKCYSGATDAAYHLLLYVPPAFPEIENTVTANGQNTASGTEDRSMTLTCNSRGGFPIPNVSWIKDGNVLITSASSVQYTKVFTRADDRTMYTCQSESPALDIPQTTSVLVYLYYRPYLTLTPTPSLRVIEGSNLEIKCDVDSYPSASITWTRVGGQLPSNSDVTSGVLHIPSTHRADRGTYTCTAQNFVGREEESLTIDIYYPPDIRVTYINTTFTSSHRTLTCVPDGNPDTYQFGQWRHTSEDGTAIRQLIGSSSTTQSVLTLPDPGIMRRYEDTGYYICKVSNDIPDSSSYRSSSVFFVVKAPPVVNIPTNTAFVQGQIGKGVAILVHFYSRPAVTSSDVKWTRKSTELLPSDRFVTALGIKAINMQYHGVVVKVKGYVAVLNINGLATEDLGDYTVTIENSMGIERYTVTIVSTGERDELSSTRIALVCVSSVLAVVIVTCVVILILFRIRKTARTNKKTNQKADANQRRGPDNSVFNERAQQSRYEDLNLANISSPSVYEDIHDRDQHPAGDTSASCRRYTSQHSISSGTNRKRRSNNSRILQQTSGQFK